MAAYRQAKRMQRGVKLGYNQSPTADSATKFTGGVGVVDFSVEYFGNSYGSGAYPFLSSVSGTFSCRSAAVGQNGVSSIIVGDSDDPIQVGWAAQSSEDRFYLAVTRSGVTVKVYINGELKATKEQSEVKDLGDLQLAIANSSDVGFVRVWNMCLSADDVTAHYNNGDPMGYVVPKAMRGDILGYNSDFSADTDGVQPTSTTTVSVENGWLVANRESSNEIWLKITKLPNDELIRIYSLRIIVESNESITSIRFAPYVTGAGSVVSVSQGTDLGDGTTLYCVNAPILSSSLRKFNLCQVGIVGQLTSVRIKSIEITGGIILAEYLPQNLMYGRDDKTIATSWLDSAKQLPLSDEYMEPLFQSIGGYDMAANGAPEILYNE